MKENRIKRFNENSELNISGVRSSKINESKNTDIIIHMKNILIVETSRDNTGSGFNWFPDVNNIPDTNMKNAIIDAINRMDRVQLSPSKIQTIDGMIFTTHSGYYFSNLPLTLPPYKVDYIIEHIIQ